VGITMGSMKRGVSNTSVGVSLLHLSEYDELPPPPPLANNHHHQHQQQPPPPHPLQQQSNPHQHLVSPLAPVTVAVHTNEAHVSGGMGFYL